MLETCSNNWSPHKHCAGYKVGHPQLSEKRTKCKIWFLICIILFPILCVQLIFFNVAAHIEDDVGTAKKTALHTQQKTNVQSPSCIPGSRNSVKRFPRKNVENIKPDTPPVSYSQCCKDPSDLFNYIVLVNTLRKIIFVLTTARIFSPLTPLSPNIARPLQSPLPKHKPNGI